MSDSFLNSEVKGLSQEDLEVFRVIYSVRIATPTDLAIQMRKMTEQIEPNLVNLVRSNLVIREELSGGFETEMYKLSKKGKEFGAILASEEFDSIDWKDQLSNIPNEVHVSAKSNLKRFIDILGGVVGLLVLSFFLLPIAIAIKVDSPGPIFSSQIRVGLGGKIFKLWKFRTMVTDAEIYKKRIPNQASGAIFKNREDPRITRVGKFLRRTSLDELPQFWNILKGDMSLVGITAPTPDEVARYNKQTYWKRLMLKPGITGEINVRSSRSRILDFEEVVLMDLKYQSNWSIMQDLKTLGSSLSDLFSGRGAF